MSSRHDNPDLLQDFQQAIKATVLELESDPTQRWTRTAIANAGGLSRNQLYAWMGQGPQRLKQLPPRERVVRFYQGVKKPWGPLFQRLGWEPVAQVAEPPPVEEPTSDIDRRIRLLRLAIDRPGIGREEQRELEIQLARLLATKRMNEDAIKDADQALKRYRAG